MGGLKIILTAWLAVTLSFIALRVLPGDGITAQLRLSGVPQSEIASRRAALGFDDPLYVQYGRYWINLAQGDLGQSLNTQENVTQMIRARLAPTFSLALVALLIAVTFGLVLGCVPTLTEFVAQGTFFFHYVRFLRGASIALTTFALAAPAYWTATLAIFILTHQLAILPSGGTQNIKSLILPALVLGFHVSGAIARVTEASLREVLTQPFIQTARAKGMPFEVVLEHALRVAMLPVFTVTALQAGFLLGGTVIIEIIFTRRGLGSLMIQAVQEQDYPLVQGLVLLSALVYAVTRALAEFLRWLADPRLRISHE